MTSAKALLSLGKVVLLSSWRRDIKPIRGPSQLRGEELESRCVPANVYLWDPTNGFNWNTQNNWLIKNQFQQWVRTALIPGPEDYVDFRSSYVQGGNTINTNDPCIVDAGANPIVIRAIAIGDNYSQSISIGGGGLELAGPLLGPSSTSVMISPSATISGGKLFLTNHSVFELRAGTLYGTQVKVGTAAKLLITDGELGTTLTAPTIDVDGKLEWSEGDVYHVPPPDNAKTRINISPTGVFEITADGATLGLQQGPNPDPSRLSIDNKGLVHFHADGTAKLFGDYKTTGTTLLEPEGDWAGTLELGGKAEQEGGEFKLLGGTFVKTNFLGIRDGSIVGKGLVQGNLLLGFSPDDPATYRFTQPIISPGGGSSTEGAIGTIAAQNFHMFNGVMNIDIAGPTYFDLVYASGYAAFTTTDPNSARSVVGQVLPVHGLIPADTEFPFLQYQQLGGDFTTVTPPTGANWTSGKDNSKYWFKLLPTQDIPAEPGRIGGRLFRDDGAVVGAYEAGVENPMVGVTVRLLDSSGTNTLATTTSDANGLYEFTNRGPGVYVVEFGRPNGEWFTTPNAAADTIDSDADPADGRVTVVLQGDDDVDDVFAGYVPNADPVAADDEWTALLYMAEPWAPIDLLFNDTDPDGDALAITAVTQGAYGTVVLDDNDTPEDPSDDFVTYTPGAGFTGTDSFTYTVSDGNGGTDTATVSVTAVYPGTVTGRMWLDADLDGIQDGGEADLSGVAVQLFDAEGNFVAEAWTDGAGVYVFQDVAPGQYTVRVAPVVWSPSPQNQGGDDGTDSDLNGSGISFLFTVTSGGTIDIDGGLTGGEA